MRLANVLLGFLLLPGVAAAAQQAVPDCRIGMYRFDDGATVDIGAGIKGLRWRMADGRTGVLAGEAHAMTSSLGSTGRSDGHRVAFDPCTDGRLRFDGRPAQRMAFEVFETTFLTDGVRLVGRLVLPRGDAMVPVVVLVHGSERSSALDYNAWQRELPAAGVGAFVYDKRGTGRSGGRYTQDFAVLANDAAAAAAHARELTDRRLQALVYAGASQGGWVVPLAQARHRADRLIVSYGLTVSPLEENRSEALQALAAEGYGDADMQLAADVVNSTGVLMASGFRQGFAEYTRLHRLHRNAPWFTRIEGEFSGQLLRYPPWLLHLAAPVARRRSNLGTPWRHDPMPPLRAVDVPQLWVLAGADTEAPPAQTRIDLSQLRSSGHAVTVLEFPGTDHGIVEFETAADGTRRATRVADGYLRAVVDFAQDGVLNGDSFGDSVRNSTAPAQPSRSMGH